MIRAPKDGGPAFPHPAGTGQYSMPQDGMSLRDWLAGMAMQAILVDAMPRPGISGFQIAADAYGMADLMLAERAKGQGQ